MSYTHYQIERDVSGNADLATNTSYFLTPGYSSFTLRAVSVVVTTAIGGAPVTVTVTHRPTAGSDTGETAVSTVTVPVSTPSGTAVFVDGLEQLVEPGGEIEFLVGGAGTGNGHIVAFIQPAWELPGNNPNMVRSA